MKYVNTLAIALLLTLAGCSGQPVGFDVKHHLPPVEEVIPATPKPVVIKEGMDARIAHIKTKNHDTLVVKRLDEARENYSIVFKSFETPIPPPEEHLFPFF